MPMITRFYLVALICTAQVGCHPHSGSEISGVVLDAPSEQPQAPREDAAMSRVTPGSAFQPGLAEPVGLIEAAFFIDTTEVSVAQYRVCVEAGVCLPPQTRAWHEHTPGRRNWGEAGRDDHPINDVSAYQAMAYCRWRGARLPSSLEWLRAAYGDGGRPFPWGQNPVDCARAIHTDGKVTSGGVIFNNTGCGTGLTAPIGTRPAGQSPFGVMDMLGNVAEWVQASTAGLTPLGRGFGAASASPYHLYGGSFGTNAAHLTRASIEGGDGAGFRCARGPQTKAAVDGPMCRCTPDKLTKGTLPTQGGCYLGADLKGLKAQRLNLQGTCLSGADLTMAELEDAHLAAGIMDRLKASGANLRRAHLYESLFAEADLSGANLKRANLKSADFRGANLKGASLYHAKAGRARFQDADLRGADLSGARLAEANLRGADMSGALIDGLTTLTDAISDGRTRWPAGFDPRARGVHVLVPGADLSDLTLQHLDLSGIDLSGANLQGANLLGSDMSGANLQGANLQNIKLNDTILWNAWLVDTNLRHAVYNIHTVWPYGLDPRQLDALGPHTDPEKSDLRGMVLKRHEFHNLDLRGLDLSRTHFKWVSFIGCRLDRLVAHRAHWEDSFVGSSSVRHARFLDTAFTKTKMFKNDFSGTLFQDVRWLESELWRNSFELSRLDRSSLERSAWRENAPPPHVLRTTCVSPKYTKSCPKGAQP